MESLNEIVTLIRSGETVDSSGKAAIQHYYDAKKTVSVRYDDIFSRVSGDIKWGIGADSKNHLVWLAYLDLIGDESPALIEDVFHGEIFNEEMDKLTASLAPAQKEFLVRNTNMRPVPKTVMLLLQAKSAKTFARIVESQDARIADMKRRGVPKEVIAEFELWMFPDDEPVDFNAK